MFIRYTVMIFGEKFTPTQIDDLQLENIGFFQRTARLFVCQPYP